MMTLKEIHEALIERLREAFPEEVFVCCYPEVGRALPLPAIIVELAEFEPTNGDGRPGTMVDAKFEARVVVDPNSSDAQYIVRDLSLRLARALFESVRLLPGHGHNVVHMVGPSDFRPETEAYLVWLVEWSIELAFCHVEPTVPIPTSVMASFGDYGTGNEADYVQLR